MHAVGQVLKQIDGNIKADDECQILLRKDLLEKAACNYLFLGQSPMHAVTAVNEQTNRQGLVREGRKILDGLRLPVFQNLKMVLLKIGNQKTMLVLHGKNHIHQVHVLAEDRNIVLAIGSSLFG